jgi:MYXO-CTERM domain-containing protein
MFARATSSAWILVAVLGPAAASFAADICGETVPANRFVDGIPAYAQCTASTSGAVYSDNGVNTSTTSGGTTWVRTQGSGGYQCTELAHRYLYFKWNVKSVPNGNAGTWCDNTPPAGLTKVPVPVHGDLIVFPPGSCGADATTGHVALVDTVAADGLSIMAVQQNSAGRSKYNMTCAACFLHATANDGTGYDGGVVDAGAISEVGVDVDVAKRDDVGVRDTNLLGTGGALASGGAPGTGGAAGTGGAQGTGGAASTGGVTGAAGTPSTSASQGCSCHVGGEGTSSGHLGDFAVILLLGTLVGGTRRRRR